MARIRTIKPEFWQHEDLSGLAPETHMLAAALLNYADDEGYFNANPRLVQSQCLPLRDDSTSIRRSLDDLSSVGFIRLFEGLDGKQYGHIVKFLDHQRIDRPKESKIKDLEDSTNDRRGIDEESTPEGKGREQGTGNREGKETLLVDSDEPTEREKKSGRHEYTPEFDALWQEYPKREGGNPKWDAFKAYRARLRNGSTHEEMLEGVRRYSAYAEAKGITGTQFVQTGPRFFGPAKPFREEWSIAEPVPTEEPPDPDDFDDPERKRQAAKARLVWLNAKTAAMREGVAS